MESRDIASGGADRGSVLNGHCSECDVTSIICRCSHYYTAPVRTLHMVRPCGHGRRRAVRLPCSQGRSELRPRVDPLREGTKGGKREMGGRAEAGGAAVSPAAAPRAVCIDPLPGAPQAHTPGPARPGPRYPNNTSEAAPEAGRGPQRGDTARRGGEREREIGGRNPRAPWTREPTGGIRRAVPGPPPPAAARFRGTAALRVADPSPHTGVCR